MSTREQAPFGALLLRYRAAAHLTQEQLAARAGLSVDAIAALERGKRRTPRAATVELLAGALGLDDAARAEFLAVVQSASVASVAEDAAGTRRPTRRWLLPAELTPLVARVGELDTIRQRLSVEGVRLLTLTGPAGVGKTRLALAAAAQLAEDSDHFPAGVIFADLTPVRDPDLVLGVIAQTLGQLDVGSRPVLDRLAETLGDRRQLVVLDNFEQVLPAAASLAELLGACPGLQVLVTSRVPLRLRWEQTLRVPPLAVPDPSVPLPPLEELAAIPSVALFVQRACAHRANFTLSEKQAPLVAELVVQLDGLPLALELAAARLDVLSLPALTRRLGDRLRLLASEAPDRPERQQSLEAAVGWSYDLLSEAERRLFRCLGVFAGRVSLEAIAAVAGAVSVVRAAEAAVGAVGSEGAGPEAGDGGARDAGRTLPRLLALAEKSLLLPIRPAELAWQQGGGEEAVEDKEDADSEPAFGMLETVREYAEERLAATGELEAASRRHAHYFLALAERAGPQLRGHGQRTWFFRLEREHANLQVALRWLLDQDDQDDPAEREAALQLAGALGPFWFLRGYLAEGLRWLEEALDRAPPGADPAVRIGALLTAGEILVNRGDLIQARAVLDRALSLAQQLQDPAAITQALTYLGMWAVFAGEGERAIPLQEEALRCARALGEPWYIGLALFYLGVTTETLGGAETAIAQYTEALGFIEAAGDARIAGVIHLNLGMSASQLGDLPDAVRHVRAGLAASARLRDRRLLSYCVQAVLAVLGATGAQAYDQGDPVARARLLGVADVLLQVRGDGHALWEPEWADRSVQRLRAHLTEGEWEAAYREGRGLPAGDVVRLALRLLDDAATSPSYPDGGREASPRSAAPGREDPLTAREREVLRLVAEGLSSKAIGRRLFLSASTVNQHITSIFHKLGADTRAQAVAKAAQRGLL